MLYLPHAGILGLQGAGIGPIPSIFFSATNMDIVSPFDAPFPASIAAGDWLLSIGAAMGVDATLATLAAQSGFSELGTSPFTRTGALRQVRLWLRGKVADGSESGTNLTFTFGGANLSFVCGVARLTNVNTASPIEGLSAPAFDENPHTIPTIDPAGTNRRGVFVLAVGENQDPSNPLVNGSGGDAAPTLLGHLQTTIDQDRCLALYTAAMTADSPISGWQQVVDFVAAHAIFAGFCVKPTGS